MRKSPGSLRKQIPPSSTSPGSGPISVWIRLFPFNFRSLEYSQTTLHCNFRAMVALGSIVKLIYFQGCGNQRTKRQPLLGRKQNRPVEGKKKDSKKQNKTKQDKTKQLTALFTNMGILKFKRQLTISLPSIILTDLLGSKTLL